MQVLKHMTLADWFDIIKVTGASLFALIFSQISIYSVSELTESVVQIAVLTVTFFYILVKLLKENNKRVWAIEDREKENED